MNIPEDIPVIQVAKTVCQHLKSHGFEGFLIGEQLMKTNSPYDDTKTFIDAIH